MSALTAGTSAPDFTLQSMDGKQFSLKDALKRGPVVLAFFKISCPVCQFAFPFLERIYKSHGGKKVTIVGVSQNSKKDTAAFVKEYGVTFPVLLDDTDSYPASNAYGLTNVPHSSGLPRMERLKFPAWDGSARKSTRSIAGRPR